MVCVTVSGYIVCAGVGGKRGCCAARAKPRDQFKLDAHRCTSSLPNGTGCEGNDLRHTLAIGMATC